jgi:hypothetical protein
MDAAQMKMAASMMKNMSPDDLERMTTMAAKFNPAATAASAVGGTGVGPRAQLFCIVLSITRAFSHIGGAL